MHNEMMTVEKASKLIEEGATLIIAGSHKALAQLPAGNWIGGTSYYFVTEEGGCTDFDNVFVTEISQAVGARILVLDKENIHTIGTRPFRNGITVALIPGYSEVHRTYALEAPSYDNIFDQPLMGWIAGVHLDDVGTLSPQVFDGRSTKAHENAAVVMYIELPANKSANIDILNLFEQDMQADEIQFPETGFSTRKAIVNGEEVDFAVYLARTQTDTSLPLVANYAGAMINVSYQEVHPENGVSFFAPVIAGVTYRMAKSPGDYASVFTQRSTKLEGNELACNCVLNYVYGELEGKKTGNVTGPATFGEIAYILINQTLVNVSLQANEIQKVA